MEFNKKLYELRKQKGISQEELVDKLNVTRQTLSKWELGTSTPDMERLISIADYFELSLDELVLGKGKAEVEEQEKEITTMAQLLDQKVLSENNKDKTKKVLRIAAIVGIAVLGVDLVSLVVAFFLGVLK